MTTFNQTCPYCLRPLEEGQDIIELGGELIHRPCSTQMYYEDTMEGQEAAHTPRHIMERHVDREPSSNFRLYPSIQPFSQQERSEFRRLLSDRPELRKSYSDFKTDSYQEVRTRVGRSPWLDRDLDILFESAWISDE